MLQLLPPSPDKPKLLTDSVDLEGFVPRTLAADEWPQDDSYYVKVYAWRQQQLLKLRQKPSLVKGAKEYYRTRPAEFINHWSNTYDPRRAATGRLTKFPFLMFPRQEQFVNFLHGLVSQSESGLVEKCRDMGATWLACEFSKWLWLFWDGAAIGWGSRKEDLVDKLGDPSSIFEKIRMSIMWTPREFLPAWFRPDKNMSYMKIVNPNTGATIIGETGDNIGRGGRTLCYFKDESSHYERPERIEAALSDNTRCQIDISSVHGLGNVFHRRREAGVDWTPATGIVKGKTNVFVMDWRDHPEKTQAWYDGRKNKAKDDGLTHVFAQEVDRDYASSVEGTIVPLEWLESCIDAHLVLKLEDGDDMEAGGWIGALDVADQGPDLNALALRKGVVLKSSEEWGERDTGRTARRAVTTCEPFGEVEIQYDCIGVGAGIKAEINRLAEEELLPEGLVWTPWNAGSGVLFPYANVEPDDPETPLNKDFYGNLKAQAWWQFRRRVEKTHRAIHEKIAFRAEELISISSDIPLLRKLLKELAQPTAAKNGRLQLIVDKTPNGMKSPNMADAVVMNYCPMPRGSSAAAMPYVIRS